MLIKAHVLQHVPFEGLGSIEGWLQASGAAIGYTRFFEDDPLPSLDTTDLIIVMGGPMSANDEGNLPWLRAEKQFIRDAIARDISVLGVCLGAQLIASAMGARVYRNHTKEIGWFSVRAVSAVGKCFRFPQQSMAFHWHGETFDLPQGTVHLARSIACEHQAFQLKNNVIGLQFHLETTRESMLALIENCRDELNPGPYIQNEEVLQATPDSSYQAISTLMSDVLRYLTRTK